MVMPLFVFYHAVEGRITFNSRVWSHAFQKPNVFDLHENSLTTLGQKDPVSEENSKLWNTGSEVDKEIARKENESYLIYKYTCSF